MVVLGGGAVSYERGTPVEGSYAPRQRPTVGHLGGACPQFRVTHAPYRKEPPYVPTILPTVGHMGNPLKGCFKNPLVVGYQAENKL